MAIIRHRQGTAATWAAENPVVRAGEWGVELDTGLVKMGDGMRNWLDLPYFLPSTALDEVVASMRRAKIIESRLSRDYIAMPSTMYDPPTITMMPASTTSSIPDAVTVEPDAPSAARYIGAVPMRGSVYPDSVMLLSNHNGVTLTSPNGSLPWAVEFDHNGSVIEVLTKGRIARFRVLINDQYAGDRMFNSVANDGAVYPLKIDFGGVWKTRRIRIEMNGTFQVGNFFLEPRATMWATAPSGPRVCFMGDSYTEPTIIDSSTDLYTAHDGWATVCARHLGWSDCFILGSGGTGYLAPGAGGRVKFRDRVVNDVINRNPDIVVVAGGLNDNGFDLEDLTAEASLLFNQIVESLPGVQLYVISPFYPEQSAPGIIARGEAIRTAVPDGAHYIDVLTPSFLTGFGDQDHPTSTGNSTLFIGGDNAHPTKAGHEYFGRRIAGMIRTTTLESA